MSLLDRGDRLTIGFHTFVYLYFYETFVRMHLHIHLMVFTDILLNV